jgi:predicted  nucleic acid-binding Zn-ribbon protein
MKRVTAKNVAVVFGIICILLIVSIVEATASYTSTIIEKETKITSQDATISNLNFQIANKNSQLTENNNTISSLNSQISDKDSQIRAFIEQASQLRAWLDGNITALNAKIMSLQNQVNSSNSQIATLQSEVNYLDSQIMSLQNQVSINNSTITNLQGQDSSLNSRIATLQDQSSFDKSTIFTLQNQVSSANSQLSSLNSTVAILQNQVNDLNAINNMNKPKLQTLVFHVCEKEEEWCQLPNVSSTYSQIQSLNNNTYNIVLLPEYKANKNWTEELSWLRGNFGGQQGIPVMLFAFGGGEAVDEAIIPQLSIDNISEAIAACNVKYLRFAEVTSWYIEHNQSFPTAYVKSVLDLCRANGLKVFWTEWKNETFSTVQTSIKGYEDIVTVSFSTNSEFVEPAVGFMQLSQMFQHWGGSVQAWYWEERYNTTLQNMPPLLLVEQALFAKQIGAEIIQFEPYWYFFDNGIPNENLNRLMTILP